MLISLSSSSSDEESSAKLMRFFYSAVAEAVDWVEGWGAGLIEVSWFDLAVDWPEVGLA